VGGKGGKETILKHYMKGLVVPLFSIPALAERKKVWAKNEEKEKDSTRKKEKKRAARGNEKSHSKRGGKRDLKGGPTRHVFPREKGQRVRQTY